MININERFKSTLRLKFLFLNYESNHLNALLSQTSVADFCFRGIGERARAQAFINRRSVVSGCGFASLALRDYLLSYLLPRLPLCAYPHIWAVSISKSSLEGLASILETGLTTSSTSLEAFSNSLFASLIALANSGGFCGPLKIDTATMPIATTHSQPVNAIRSHLTFLRWPQIYLTVVFVP